MDSVDVSRSQVSGELMRINVWALALVMALVLEQTAGALAEVANAEVVGARVVGAVSVMVLVFGILLATTVGITVLHVRYGVRYRYWQVVLDNVFVAVPLYLAVRFVAVSAQPDDNGAEFVGVNDTTFQMGLVLIALAFAALVVRDFFVLPELEDEYGPVPLVLVATAHAIGAVLALFAAIWPQTVSVIVPIGAISLAIFFGGMASLKFFESRLRRVAPVDPAA